MRVLKIFAGIWVLAMFFSCSESTEKQASAKFDLAVTVCQKGDTLRALQCLDSIPRKFPEALGIIEKTKTYSKKINLEILIRKQNQLKNLINRIVILEKPFTIEKTEYDRYKQYIPKMQNSERRWNQSYIQLHLDERGELFITSNYYGSEWLNHVGLRVYDGTFQAKTDTVSLEDLNNHHSEFMGTHWEKVSYKNGKDNGVIQFIAENSNRNLKAVFLGKRMYFIVLESFDKQAVKDGLALSTALKQKNQLEKDIRELQPYIR